MDNKYLSVSAITRYLKNRFDADENLRRVYLKGEISNIKYHSTGHIYLSIKDENSKINAIMFSSNAKKLLFKPVDGSKVLVTGRITVYEATGGYQIYIEETWEVDENGEFTGEQKENACGVLIVSDEIEAIEFFD